ncbi:MAG: hypothetical protein HQL69_19220 [Magnetococcales bacterium]|nr:hypothetical protein [Magnetococcales bacterium]
MTRQNNSTEATRESPLMTEKVAKEKTIQIKNGSLEAGKHLKAIRKGKGWEALGYKNWELYLESELGMKRAQANLLIHAYEVSNVIGQASSSILSANALYAFWAANKPIKGKDNRSEVKTYWKQDLGICQHFFPGLKGVTEAVVKSICVQSKVARYLAVDMTKLEKDTLAPLIDQGLKIQKRVWKHLTEPEGVDSETTELSITKERVQQAVEHCTDTDTEDNDETRGAGDKGNSGNKGGTDDKSESGDKSGSGDKDKSGGKNASKTANEAITNSDVDQLHQEPKTEGNSAIDDQGETVDLMLRGLADIFASWLELDEGKRQEFQDNAVLQAKAHGLFFKIGKKEGSKTAA